MLFARPFQHVVQQLFQLAVVACGKACKRNFIIARVLAQRAARRAEHTRIPLAHGPVQKASLAEAAASHTAAQHLDLCTVMHGAYHRHHKIARKRLRVHIRQNSLCHHGWRTAARLYLPHAPVREIGNIVQRRHIYARYLRQLH